MLSEAKYIYLDWNVIKYMKEPRLEKKEIDEKFKDIVFKLKKKYKFPYSMAHIKDRANHCSEEHYIKIKEDFEFAETVNDTICVAIDKDKPVLVKENMLTCFDDYIAKSKQETPYIDADFPFSFSVDMDRISEDHPMYDFLKVRDGKISPTGMEEFLQELYKDIFQDASKYKKLREYIKNFDVEKALNQEYSFNEIFCLQKLLFHLYPFLDSFQDDIDTLEKKWLKIAKCWFSLDNNNLRQDLLLIQGYTLLDMHPLFNEKLKKRKNTLDNILRDGNHCFYASNAQYFVSEDEDTRKKTTFLYKVYGIKTKVVNEEDFLNCFEIMI